MPKNRIILVIGFFIALLIAAPWHILATLRNPPYFSFSLHSGPGEYHGFLWFYFINEQVLRELTDRKLFETFAESLDGVHRRITTP